MDYIGKTVYSLAIIVNIIMMIDFLVNRQYIELVCISVTLLSLIVLPIAIKYEDSKFYDKQITDDKE